MRRVFCLVSLETCNAGFFEAIQNHNKEAARFNSQLVSVQKTDKTFRKTPCMHFLVGIGSWTHENSSFGANNQQNSTGSKNIARCLSWEPQSQIPSNPIEFIKKMMQKKVFIVTGSNLGNVQTFEAGRKRILDQNWCCLDSNACTSEGIDRIDPKTFFCITNFHKKISSKGFFDLSADDWDLAIFLLLGNVAWFQLSGAGSRRKTDFNIMGFWNEQGPSELISGLF